MMDFMFYLIIIACFGVVVVLMTGLGGFAKGDGWAKDNANRIMRWRIGAQFVAVILIVIVILIRRANGDG